MCERDGTIQRQSENRLHVLSMKKIIEPIQRRCCCDVGDQSLQTPAIPTQSTTWINTLIHRFVHPSIHPLCWNNMPTSIRSASTLESFKSRLKTHYFKKS